jgi:hypothetical protein
MAGWLKSAGTGRMSGRWMITGTGAALLLVVVFEEVRLAQVADDLAKACTLLYETDRAMMARRIEQSGSPGKISVLDHMDALINGWEAPEAFLLAQRLVCR